MNNRYCIKQHRPTEK